MDAKFIKQDGKVYLWLSDRFLAYHAARVACGKRLGNYWGERRYGGSQIEIPLEKVEATRKQVMHIVEEFNKPMMEALDVVTGETRCFTNDWTPDYTGGFILSHPDASDSLILAHQDWLEENTGRVLVNPVHRMWGWSLPAGISDWSYSVLEGLPDGWRGWWVPKMDVPEIVKQFNSIEVEVIL